MSFIKYVQKERKVLTDQKHIRWWIILILWICGFISGAILVSGCGATAREVCKATPKVLGGVLEDTGRICTNGAKAMTSSSIGNLPASGQGSMALDNIPADIDIDAIAQQYGYTREEN